MFDAIPRFFRGIQAKLDVAWYSYVVTTKARQLDKKRQYVTPDLYEWADRVDSLFESYPDLLISSAIWQPDEAMEILSWIAELLDEYTEAMGSHVVSTSV